MKKLLLLFGISLSVFVLQSCEGPVGPPGPQGPQGNDGYYIVGEVLEVKGSFNAANDYSVSYDVNPMIEPGDKIVGFILEGEDNLGYDNWEPLPQTHFVGNYTYQFTFNFSQAGFTLFLIGNGLLNDFPVDSRTNRYFRMLIIPADLVGKVTEHNYSALMNQLKLNNADIKVIDL